MAAKEMYDYLTTIAPDVDQTLSITAQGVISEEGAKAQAIHAGDDGSEERVSIASSFKFYATFDYKVLSESDMGTFFDLYFDSAKANGIVNSFKWVRGDGHTYVVRFDTAFNRSGPRQSLMGSSKIKLRILGRVAD